MSSEMTTLLDRATPESVEPMDYQRLARRGRRRRRAKQTAGATAGMAGLVAVTAGVMMTQSPPSPEVVATPEGLAATCTVIDIEIVGDRMVDGIAVGAVDHFQAGDPTAPPPEELYLNGRPTASGPHYANFAPVTNQVAASQLDERAITHNLEHGAVAIWFDPEQVLPEDIEQMEALITELHASGFAQPDVGAGVFASPYTDPGIDSGAAVALRAWGAAIDCDTWDADTARQFTTAHYGSNGTAPEGQLAPHPGN